MKKVIKKAIQTITSIIKTNRKLRKELTLTQLALLEKKQTIKDMSLYSKEQLTMKQLGVYIPTYQGLSNEYKDALGAFAQSISLNDNHIFIRFIDDLIQGQAHYMIQNSNTDNYTRGVISGLYNVKHELQRIGDLYSQGERNKDNTNGAP